MAYRITEGCLFSPENVLRQNGILFKSLSQQVFSFSVGIHLLDRVDCHDKSGKVQITERNSRLQAVGSQTSVRTQHIVEVKLTQSLFRFLLELLCVGRKVRIFITKQFVGNFTGEKHLDVGSFMDCLTYQIHTHAGTNGGNVVGGKRFDNRL